MQYFLEINDNTGHYEGRIHQGDPTNACPLSNLELGPNTHGRIS